MRSFFITIAILCSLGLAAQPARFSFATDLGLQRSFRKDQRYWAIGHTVHGHFHFTDRQGLYGSFAYFSAGRFRHQFTATAKSATTTPQNFSFHNNTEMRFKLISLGWKQYVRGRYNVSDNWNLYGSAGFGLMLGRVTNEQDPAVDTSLYEVPVYRGMAHFKRLTFDLALGWEVPIGGEVYFYTEGRLFVPTTDYPSRHLLVNENAPLAAAAVAGIRILF